MTGINALFPLVDARRVLKGAQKIHWCFGAETVGACAGFQRLATHPRDSDMFVLLALLMSTNPQHLACPMPKLACRRVNESNALLGDIS